METGLFSSKRILMRELDFRDPPVNSKIYGPKFAVELKQFRTHAVKLFRTLEDLFGANEGNKPAIFLHSHVSRMSPEDAIEIRQPGLNSGLGLYANDMGEMYFYLLYTPVEEASGKIKRLKSSGTNYGDAIATQEMLTDFIRGINVQGIEMYVPTEKNPRVILTKQGLFPIASSSDEDLVGMILEPDVGSNTKWARGKIRFMRRVKAGGLNYD